MKLLGTFISVVEDRLVLGRLLGLGELLVEVAKDGLLFLFGHFIILHYLYALRSKESGLDHLGFSAILCVRRLTKTGMA